MASNNSQFKAGGYLLETLTSGMYNDPLAIYREYIQNSVDSIDLMNGDGRDIQMQINLDPLERTITFVDGGQGLPASGAEQVLSSIGDSNKKSDTQRGFRGIGRLGGIAYGDKATFRTKAQGESTESIQKWDCRALRKYNDNPQANSSLSLEDFFNQITTFKQKKSKHPKQRGFFEVKLEGVTSYRNKLFDTAKVAKYIQQVAPLPFDPDFKFGSKISNFLAEKVPNYCEYDITFNDSPLYRPYKNYLEITNKAKKDWIEDIEFVELFEGGKLLAVGWFARRQSFLGALKKGEICSGIRMRVGNIQIGGPHILDLFYRESRFNSYMAGEIHIVSPDLTPNGRRDDFVDNTEKNYLHRAFETTVGIPISKEIRRRSRVQSENKSSQIDKELTLKRNEQTLNTKIPESKNIRQEVRNNNFKELVKNKEFINELVEKCQGCLIFQEILKKHQK